MIHDIPWQHSSCQPRSANVAVYTNDIMERVSAQMLLFSFNVLQPESSHSVHDNLSVGLKTQCSQPRWPYCSRHWSLPPLASEKTQQKKKKSMFCCCCFLSSLAGPTFVIWNQMQRPPLLPSLVKRASSLKFPACVLSGVLMVNRRNT